jgi:hypothetical protein
MFTFHFRISSVLCFSTLLLGVVAVFLLSDGPLHAQTSARIPTLETQHSQAGVIATDVHWGLAEQLGDTEYLGQMLLSDYQSVDTNKGTVKSKEQILAGAAKRKGTSAAAAQKKIDDYKKAHPYDMTVLLHGDLAILNSYDPAKGVKDGVESVDIFVYTGGRWHGIYSQ